MDVRGEKGLGLLLGVFCVGFFFIISLGIFM